MTKIPDGTRKKILSDYLLSNNQIKTERFQSILAKTIQNNISIVAEFPRVTDWDFEFVELRSFLNSYLVQGKLKQQELIDLILSSNLLELVRLIFGKEEGLNE